MVQSTRTAIFRLILMDPYRMCIKRIVHRFDGTEGNSKISMALREDIKISMALREFILKYLFLTTKINYLVLKIFLKNNVQI